MTGIVAAEGAQSVTGTRQEVTPAPNGSREGTKATVGTAERTDSTT